MSQVSKIFQLNRQGFNLRSRRRLRGRAGAADHRGRAPSGAEVLPHGDLRGADRGRERPRREVRLPGAPAGRGRRGRCAADGPGIRHRWRGLGVRGAGRLRGHVAGRAGGDIRPAPIRRGLSAQRLVHHRPRPADSHLLPSAGSVRLRPDPHRTVAAGAGLAGRVGAVDRLHLHHVAGPGAGHRAPACRRDPRGYLAAAADPAALSCSR